VIVYEYPPTPHVPLPTLIAFQILISSKINFLMMELELALLPQLLNEIKGPGGYFETTYQYLICHSIAIVITNKLTKVGGW